MRCWLIIVPPVCIIVVGCFVPLLCCVDVLITILCTFIDVVSPWLAHWSSAVHGVTLLSTLVTNNASFSVSCWLIVGLSSSFVMLSFERRSLSNFSFSFCWVWGVVTLLMLAVAPVTCSFVALLALLTFMFSFSFVLSFAGCSYVHWCCSSIVVCWDNLQCVLFGIQWLLSVSPRMLVMLLHWDVRVASMVLLFWSSELPPWLDLVDLYCCLIRAVELRIPSCWMILRSC